MSEELSFCFLISYIISGWDKRFFASLKGPNRLWGPIQHTTQSLLRDLAPGLKLSGREPDYSPNLVSRLRMSEVIPPRSHMPSWCIGHRLWYRRTISRFPEKYTNRWLRFTIDHLEKLFAYSSVARIAVTAAPPVHGGNGCGMRKTWICVLKIAKGLYILVLNQLNIWKI